MGKNYYSITKSRALDTLITESVQNNDFNEIGLYLTRQFFKEDKQAMTATENKLTVKNNEKTRLLNLIGKPKKDRNRSEDGKTELYSKHEIIAKIGQSHFDYADLMCELNEKRDRIKFWLEVTGK